MSTSLQAHRHGQERRLYDVIASRPGGFMNWPGQTVRSDARIRVVAAAWFRRWFGSAPTFVWGADGREGEAWDDRGNRLHVRQLNDR